MGPPVRSAPWPLAPSRIARRAGFWWMNRCRQINPPPETYLKRWRNGAVDGMCTLDADVQAHEADARALGFRRFDLSTAEPDVAAGLATVGFDLAAEVPGDCAGIYVPECAPGFAACVATGLLAAERGDVPVYGVPVLDAAAAKPWRDALVAGLRLACDGPGLAGLLAAVAHHAEQASGVAEARVALLSD